MADYPRSFDELEAQTFAQIEAGTHPRQKHLRTEAQIKRRIRWQRVLQAIGLASDYRKDKTPLLIPHDLER